MNQLKKKLNSLFSFSLTNLMAKSIMFKMEHSTNPEVKARDREKEKIFNLQLIRIPNSYARRNEHIKDAVQRLLKD
jgi:hypothetical protein